MQQIGSAGHRSQRRVRPGTDLLADCDPLRCDLIVHILGCAICSYALPYTFPCGLLSDMLLFSSVMTWILKPEHMRKPRVVHVAVLRRILL